MRHAVLCVVFLLLAIPLAPTVGAAAVDAGTDSPAHVAEDVPGYAVGDADHAVNDADHTVNDADHAVDDASPGYTDYDADSVSQPSLGAPGGQADLAASFTAPSETELRVVLHENRNAKWVITVTYELDDENETAAFREIADSFVEGDTGPSVDPFRNYAAGASEATGREMEIVDVERSVDVEEDPETDAVEGGTIHAVGELRLSFTWSNFLDADGERLILGDAFLTPDETTWLRSLGPQQTLYIQTPEDHSIQSTPGVTVDLRDNALVVEGPRTFESDERVMAVYQPTVGPGPEAPPWGLLAGAVVAAGLIVAGALLIYRRRGGEGAPARRTPPADTPGSANGGNPRPSAVGASADANGDSAGETAPAEDDVETDLSLLSDEEQVERLLERNGGRMRQADIVEETGWSDAKVSQLLSAMADDDRVEKLRLGRENLISLPDGEGKEGETA